jgi:putative ABC transport system permease protein
VAAGLTIKSVTKLKTMNPGYRTSHIFTARVGFPEENADTSAQRRFFEQLADRLQAIPGVRSAALMAGLPGVDWDETPFEVEGRAYASDRDVPNAYTYAVSPRFFGTFGIPVLAGRNFTTADLPTGSPVVIVNQAFADVYLGGGDVLGRRVRAGGRTSTASWMTVVGVVPTTFSGDQHRPRTPAYYVPLAQHPTRSVSIAAFTAGPPMAITGEVRNVVASLDPDLPIYWTYSQDEAMARQLWFIGVFGAIFTLFGFVALFLSALGLYAVMSFSVSRRTREVGIRMALGAQPRDVMRMVVGQGVLQITIGMAAGLAFAAMLAQLLGVVLFQVQPRDPTIFAGVAVVLAFTGLAACLIPALRATAVDPLTALRAE